MADQQQTILIAGASRGIGLALAREFADRGWRVIGTVRQPSGTGLHKLAAEREGAVRVEQLDITLEESLDALPSNIDGERLDALIVNAGIVPAEPFGPIESVSQDEFAHVMLTNAYGPMAVITRLAPLMKPDGLVGAISSEMGSIGNNGFGGADAYRASKAALNMLMKNFALRPENASRPLVLMAPGWIKTDLGGPNATFTLEETIPAIVGVLIAKGARPGLEYLDRFDRPIAW